MLPTQIIEFLNVFIDVLDKYRRAFWFTFDSKIPRNKFNLTRIISGLVTICSIVTSFTFLELANILSVTTTHQKKALISEIFILIFSYIELILQYFIRPKFQTTTLFLILINFLSLLPIALFLFIWVRIIFSIILYRFMFID